MKYTQTIAQKFDPVEFLGIKGLGKSEQEDLRKKLEVNISEYILIRLLEGLPDKVDKQLKKEIENIDELEKMLKSHIPDLENKVEQYLQEFKNQYQNERS